MDKNSIEIIGRNFLWFSQGDTNSIEIYLITYLAYDFCTVDCR